MYPPNFDYYRANTLDEAVSLLGQHKGAKVLTGIGRISALTGIKASGKSVTIGATTPHAVIAASSAVPKALSEAAGGIGDPQVRNRGTIGGNVANADPASDLPTVLVALGATIVAVGPKGERTIPADGFFTGIMTTALADNEVVTAVMIPVAGRGQGSAYVKF